MPDPSPPPNSDRGADHAAGSAPPTPGKPQGWPLWLRIGLAAVILSFVWSPFLAMLMRLSQVKPSLQPTGGSSDFTPPAQPAPSPAPATSPPAPAPSP